MPTSKCNLCGQDEPEILSGWREYDRFSICPSCTVFLREMIYASDGILFCESCNEPMIEEEYLVKCRCYLEDYRAHETDH